MSTTFLESQSSAAAPVATAVSSICQPISFAWRDRPPTSNTFSVYRSSDDKVVCTRVEGKYDSSELFKKLLSKMPTHPSTTENMVKSKMKPCNDGDISMTSLRASLNCPISRTRIVLPCRGRLCQHLQCVDGQTMLELNVNKPKWTCPVCGQPLTIADINVDGLFKHILRSVPEDVEVIKFSKDGTWHHNKEPDANISIEAVEIIDLEACVSFIDLTETDDEEEATEVTSEDKAEHTKSPKTSEKVIENVSAKKSDKVNKNKSIPTPETEIQNPKSTKALEESVSLRNSQLTRNPLRQIQMNTNCSQANLSAPYGSQDTAGCQRHKNRRFRNAQAPYKNNQRKMNKMDNNPHQRNQCYNDGDSWGGYNQMNRYHRQDATSYINQRNRAHCDNRNYGYDNDQNYLWNYPRVQVINNDLPMFQIQF